MLQKIGGKGVNVAYGNKTEQSLNNNLQIKQDMPFPIKHIIFYLATTLCLF